MAMEQNGEVAEIQQCHNPLTTCPPVTKSSETRWKHVVVSPEGVASKVWTVSRTISYVGFQIEESSFKSSQLRPGELWVGGSVIFVISGVGLVG